MTAYFDSSDLQKIYVQKNAQTIYFTVDSMKYSGMNEAKSSEIKMFLKNNDIERVSMLTEPSGIYYPFNQIPAGKERLEGFDWRMKEMPKSFKGLFRNKKNIFSTPSVYQFDHIVRENHWKRYYQIKNNLRTSCDSINVTINLQDTIKKLPSDSLKKFYATGDSSRFIIFNRHKVDTIEQKKMNEISLYNARDSSLIQISFLDNAAQINDIIWDKKGSIIILGLHNTEKALTPTRWSLNVKTSKLIKCKYITEVKKEKKGYSFRKIEN